MPEEKIRPADHYATEAPANAIVSDSPSTGATSLALPIVDDGTISLRVTIDFQRSPSPPAGGLKASQRLTEGGSEDTKGTGDREHPSRHSATGS